MRKILLSCLFLFLTSFEALSGEIPDPVQQNLKNITLIGRSELRYFGLKVYDIDLWSEKSPFSYDQKFAIHIRYNMNFSNEELAERSIEEIEKNHILSDDKKKNYYQQLLKIFASVKKGDEKVAIFTPQKGVEMFYNNHLIGKISNLELARLFVDIWLDERGSYPAVTKKILGKI